ncbi:MAG: exonuclease SbcCD subunit D [Oscillospiraceae bacterium]|nr:exonuclease SbcCD subunit D [Oscillospiraceae bacterium]
MKFLHLSDLHLGKRLCGVSLLEDQRHILDQILTIAGQVDAVLISGDVYDKPVPPGEAVTLFDSFLTQLTRRKKEVFLIPGNHDSAQRLAFGSAMLADSGVHMAPLFDGALTRVRLKDRWGDLSVWLMPFLKAAHVRPFFPDEELSDAQEAAALLLDRTEVDSRERNVLLAHQFVAGARQCQSEEVSVGGLDQVSASLFDTFDYVALGHLHTPQSVDRPTVCYCGSPLKYSVSEAGQEKSVLLVTLEEKGKVSVEAIPLIPKRDLRILRGSYDRLTYREFYSELDLDCYYHITLTDEEDIPQAMARLQTIYPNLLSIDYDNRRTRGQLDGDLIRDQEETDPLKLLAAFYLQRNGQEMTGSQLELASRLMGQIEEEEG